MSNFLLFIVGLAGALLLVYLTKNIANKYYHNKFIGGKISDVQIPKKQKKNDKLILCYNRNLEDLIPFLKNISSEWDWEKRVEYKPFMRIYSINPSLIAILFPYDVHFTVFLNIIFALVYPNRDENYNDKVFAWTTAKKEYELLNDEIMNKDMMIFVDKNDTELENINIVLRDGQTYKLSIMGEEKLTKINSTLIEYKTPEVNLEKLSEYKFKLIK